MSTTTIVLLAAALGAVALVLVKANRTGQQTALDVRVIVQLKQAGSKLDKPHDIDFFLYFPSDSAANTVAQVLASQGYKTTVNASAKSDSEWLVQASKTMIPEAWPLVEIRRSLSTLASENGGSYDGWGAAVVQ